MVSILGLCFVIVVIVCWLTVYWTSLWFYVMFVGHEYDFSLRLTARKMKAQMDKGTKFDERKVKNFNSFCRYIIALLEGVLQLVVCSAAIVMVATRTGSTSAEQTMGLLLVASAAFSAVAVGFYKIARFEGRTRFAVVQCEPGRYFIELQVVHGLSVYMREASEDAPICFTREL